MSEQENVFVFSVTVKSFGHPERALKDTTHAVAKALYHQLGDRFTISDGVDQWRYDPLGDDMGHHPGHDEALILITDTEET